MRDCFSASLTLNSHPRCIYTQLKHPGSFFTVRLICSTANHKPQPLLTSESLWGEGFELLMDGTSFHESLGPAQNLLSSLLYLSMYSSINHHFVRDTFKQIMAMRYNIAPLCFIPHIESPYVPRFGIFTVGKHKVHCCVIKRTRLLLSRIREERGECAARSPEISHSD